MAEERTTPPTEIAHISTATAEVDDELKGLLSYRTGPGTLKFIVENLQAACQRTRHREVGDSEQTDPPQPTKSPVPSARTAGSSAEPEETLAAAPVSLIVTELVSTDTWWAQRWIDKATPGEVAAMRELLVSRG